jgi:hypothetical protein
MMAHDHPDNSSRCQREASQEELRSLREGAEVTPCNLACWILLLVMFYEDRKDCVSTRQVGRSRSVEETRQS